MDGAHKPRRFAVGRTPKTAPITAVACAAATTAGLLFGAAASAGWYGTRLVADESGPPAAAATRTIGADVDSYSELVEQVAPAVVTPPSDR